MNWKYKKNCPFKVPIKFDSFTLLLSCWMNILSVFTAKKIDFPRRDIYYYYYFLDNLIQTNQIALRSKWVHRKFHWCFFHFHSADYRDLFEMYRDLLKIWRFKNTIHNQFPIDKGSTLNLRSTPFTKNMITRRNKNALL